MARILIVDDFPGTAALIARLLTQAGHQTVAVVDPSAALEKCKTEPFDLLISDINLPGKNGWELMREVLGHCQIRGIAITGNAKAHAATSREAGFDVHLSKPIDLLELVNTVDRLVSP